MRGALGLLLTAWIGAHGLALAGCSSCKGKTDPMARLDALEAGLTSKDEPARAAAVSDLPACEMPPLDHALDGLSPTDSCLPKIATALGSKKGFVPKPPDQAANAAAAVVLARDNRGDVLGDGDVWLAMLRGGKGPGPDALRAATASRMAAIAPSVGKSVEDEAAAAALAREIAGAVPGACPTYYYMQNADISKLPAAVAPDYAACVQRDLGRRTGPGAAYGQGVFRGAEGAMSFFRAAEAALRLGLEVASPRARVHVQRMLAIIEPATLAHKMKKVPSQRDTAMISFMGAVHEDAGITLFKKDGGADLDGGADGGPRDARLRGKSP